MAYSRRGSCRGRGTRSMASRQMPGIPVITLGAGMERDRRAAHCFRIDRIRDWAALRRDVAILHFERLISLDKRPGERVSHVLREVGRRDQREMREIEEFHLA